MYFSVNITFHELHLSIQVVYLNLLDIYCLVVFRPHLSFYLILLGIRLNSLAKLLFNDLILGPGRV